MEHTELYLDIKKFLIDFDAISNDNENFSVTVFGNVLKVFMILYSKELRNIYVLSDPSHASLALFLS